MPLKMKNFSYPGGLPKNEKFLYPRRTNLKGFLLTGTDTGIGKTHVAVMLAKAFLAMGIRHVGVFKPVETGVTGIPQDALKLKESADCCEEVAVVAPYTFKEPVAPWVASKQENRPISFSVLEETYRHIASKHEIIIVESAGGLFVPLSSDGTYADLAKRLELPIMVVVGLRLGAINHALLTIQVARSLGLKVLGYVLNEFERDQSPGALTVEEALREFSGVPFLGKISHGDASIETGRLIAEKILPFTFAESA